jgi:hypothetical protein
MTEAKTTMILPCKCKNEGQDSMYGIGKRVHNQCPKKGNIWRCTVCKTERPAGFREQDVKQEKGKKKDKK